MPRVKLRDGSAGGLGLLVEFRQAFPGFPLNQLGYLTCACLSLTLILSAQLTTLTAGWCVEGAVPRSSATVARHEPLDIER